MFFGEGAFELGNAGGEGGGVFAFGVNGGGVGEVELGQELDLIFQDALAGDDGGEAGLLCAGVAAGDNFAAGGVGDGADAAVGSRAQGGGIHHEDAAVGLLRACEVDDEEGGEEVADAGGATGQLDDGADEVCLKQVLALLFLAPTGVEEAAGHADDELAGSGFAAGKAMVEEDARGAVAMGDAEHGGRSSPLCGEFDAEGGDGHHFVELLQAALLRKGGGDDAVRTGEAGGGEAVHQEVGAADEVVVPVHLLGVEGGTAAGVLRSLGKEGGAAGAGVEHGIRSGGGEQLRHERGQVVRGGHAVAAQLAHVAHPLLHEAGGRTALTGGGDGQAEGGEALHDGLQVGILQLRGDGAEEGAPMRQQCRHPRGIKRAGGSSNALLTQGGQQVGE